MEDSLFFPTSADSKLAQKVQSLVPSLRLGRFRLGHFLDGEVMFYLDEPVRNKLCVVFGHTGPPANNLLEMFTILNTLKINGAKPIIAVIPYLGYSRSDRDKPLQPINSRLFGSFLKHAGAHKIICLDLHSSENAVYFSLPVNHLSAIPLMADLYSSLHLSSLVVATPDLGGSNRARLFAKTLGQKEIVVIEKSRPRVDLAECLTVKGEVNQKNVILVDDMIQTGHTLFAAAKLLKSKGAKQIYAAATHCLSQSKGIKLLTSTSLFRKIIISNSLPSPLVQPSKITVLDIAPLLATAITKEISS